MKNTSKEIKEQFSACRKLLVALGDETRQLIISVLVDADCAGLQVGEITEKTHLSRPAVSHHLKILYESKVVGMTKQATKHFYYLELGGEWGNLVSLVNEIERMRLEYANEQGECRK